MSEQNTIADIQEILVHHRDKLGKDWTPLKNNDLSSLIADAARYRWLRTRINWRDVTDRDGELSHSYRSWEHRDYRLSPPIYEEIDWYIDAQL